MALSRVLTAKRLKILVHVGALLPLALLIWDFTQGNLSVNPIQDITFRTGKPALVLLILSLTCTPLSAILGFRPALVVRRILGLYAFLYVGLHFLIFVGLDYGFDWSLLKEAVFEKRYALVGFAAFLILVPLAITSTQGWMRRLGKRWKKLHRWVYAAGLLAVLHYVWLVKSDIREPVAWGIALVLLLVARLPQVRRMASKVRSRFQPARPTGRSSQPSQPAALDAQVTPASRQ